MVNPAPRKPVLPPPEKAFSTNSILVNGILRAEGFHGHDGNDGEIGAMQIKPFAAGLKNRTMIGELEGMTEEELRNPVNNIQLGTAYLNGLFSHYDNDLDKAIVAYNAGVDNVDRAISKDPDTWLANLQVSMKAISPFNDPMKYLNTVKAFIGGRPANGT